MKEQYCAPREKEKYVIPEMIVLRVMMEDNIASGGPYDGFGNDGSGKEKYVW